MKNAIGSELLARWRFFAFGGNMIFSCNAYWGRSEIPATTENSYEKTE